jgi:hypothetical protein
LVPYTKTSDGWSSVMHINPGTGIDVSLGAVRPLEADGHR